MRHTALALLVLAALANHSVGPGGELSQTGYPFWNGAESVRDYAGRIGLGSVERTLELGDGVDLELVLIPAGALIMGTPRGESPWIGGGMLLAAGLAMLILLGVLLNRIVRERRLPQFSLCYMTAMVVLLGIAQYAGFRLTRAVDARKRFCQMSHHGREITLSKPYYVGKYEVTQEQYEQVLGTNPSAIRGLDLPVEHVLWNEAVEFCRRVSERTGWAVRLPTDAEWEYACRAGAKTRYNTGDTSTDLDRSAWYDGNSNGRAHPVGQKAANTWGIYDMHGNVSEWCADYFEIHVNEHTDPEGPSQGIARVVRGGAWYSDSWRCQSVYRSSGYLSSPRTKGRGFRVVAELPPRR